MCNSLRTSDPARTRVTTVFVILINFSVIREFEPHKSALKSCFVDFPPHIMLTWWKFINKFVFE